eukprot:COSAG02_NODE_56949_length_283_cov_0.472826_1_plen_49_part_01
MGGLDPDQAGAAAAETVVLTTITPLVVSVYCCVLGPGGAHCPLPLSAIP